MSSGLETRPGATTLDLDDLVELAWSGQIRVPHFQRDFRWTRQDVRRLFDSIVKRYPVGSLLLWRRPAPAQRLTLGALRIDAPQVDQALWVVDGQQRVSSLANALHPDGAQDPRFNLGYDVRDDRIVNRPVIDDPYVIPLPIVFDLTKVLDWFATHPEVADYRNRAFELTKHLRQFSIPAYQVVQDDTLVLRDIFDRMNNYGKRLSRAEIFSALNAGRESDAEHTLTIAQIADHVDDQFGFGRVDADTVLRAILARRGPDVHREIRLEFDDNNRRGDLEFRNEDRDSVCVSWLPVSLGGIVDGVAFIVNHNVLVSTGTIAISNNKLGDRRLVIAIITRVDLSSVIFGPILHCPRAVAVPSGSAGAASWRCNRLRLTIAIVIARVNPRPAATASSTSAHDEPLSFIGMLPIVYKVLAKWSFLSCESIIGQALGFRLSIRVSVKAVADPARATCSLSTDCVTPE